MTLGARLGSLLGAGWSALDRHRRVVAILYLVELAVASLVTIGIASSLSIVFGSRPLFDRGVAGDLAALYLSFDRRLSLLVALVASGLAVALAWAVASFYLGAGLYGVLLGRPFGESAGARFGAFFRLWLWSVIPYTVAGFILLLGLMGLERSIDEALSWGELLGAAAAALSPGLAALALVSCVVDYARAVLTLSERPAAGRAFLAAARLVFGRALPLLHFLLYLGVWVAVTIGYLLLTWGRPYEGLGGAALLFVVRQLTLGARFAARVAASAGQVVYVTERPSVTAP